MAGTAPAQRPDDPLTTMLEVIAGDLSLLAGIQDRELAEADLKALVEIGFPGCLGLSPDSAPGREAQALLAELMRRIAEAGADSALIDELAADYADIYLNHSIQASPMESVWLDEDGLVMQEPMFQVREWYQRYGLAAENWRVRPDDHLVLQLQFLAHLAQNAPASEEAGEHLSEMARFMDEHLLRWIGQFAERVVARCGTPFYAGIAQLTAAYLEQLRDLLVELLGEPRPSAEEIEERMRPRRQVEEVPVKFMPGTAPTW
ncbi:MAG: dehydrogenase [Gammaproteobacteria bacterium]|nr:MAG: dehydrogenase [Gammaproteobacteria bacterium]